MRIHEEVTEKTATEYYYNKKPDTGTWLTKPLLEVIEEKYLSFTDSSLRFILCKKLRRIQCLLIIPFCRHLVEIRSGGIFAWLTYLLTNLLTAGYSVSLT